MAQMRTKAERQRILKKCLEIENEGGNVLAYLATENYMSPAATWFNMQREMLHREHPKSGKPRAKGESAQEREDRLQRERCQKIVEAAEAGKSIRNATLFRSGLAESEMSGTEIPLSAGICEGMGAGAVRKDAGEAAGAGNGTEKKGGVSNERDHEEERADRVPGDPAGEVEDVQQEV